MRVLIEKMDNLGRGICYINDKITFVSYVYKDEIVDIELIKEYKKYNIGKVINIVKYSDSRIEEKCPYYTLCGGCDLMHITYEEELNYKVEKVSELLNKYACIKVSPKIVKCNSRFNYRNKVSLHYKDDKLGYMKSNSNEIISIAECLLLNNDINTFIKSGPFNNDLVVRTDNHGNIIYREDDKLLINVLDLIYQIDINSFFQINNYMTSEVFKYILDNIDNVNTALDLYSGVGALSLLISKKARKVYGIEVNEYSVNNALENIKLNKISNVEFLLGKVEDRINDIHDIVDLIVVDPPRSGVDEYTIKVIKDMLPSKIVYMSCNPITLARDIKLLSDKYALESVTLFDMFPCTHHVESISILKIKE